MLSEQEATAVVRRAIPGGRIQAVVSYEGKYLFQVFSNSPWEEEMAPYYSVDKQTGEFRDFSIITDGDISEIVELFVVAKRGRR